MDLDQLFTHYGSDKTRNGYAPLYHALFKNIKDRPIELLEIGIGTMIEGVHSSMVGYALPGYKPGGSLRAWRDYFKNGTIMGADVQSDTQFEDERITTVLCDSTSRGTTESTFAGKLFDIIIDDGSHTAENQLVTLMNLYKLVKPGGFYIVEDIFPGSQMSGSYLEVVKNLCLDALFFLSEPKNILVISKR